MIFRLIWRNLSRNRRRTIISITSVAFTVVIAIVFRSLQQGIFNNLIDSVVSFHTGYIQIHKKGYQEEQILGNSFLPDSAFYNSWKEYSEKTSLLHRLEGFCLLSGGEKTRGVLVIGTDYPLEDRLTGLSKRVISGKYYDNNQNSAIIGEVLAKETGVQVGDTIILLGQGYQDNLAAGKYAIAATVRMPSPESSRSLVYLPSDAAQELFRTEGRITSAVVLMGKSAYREDMIDSMRITLGDEYEVMGWKDMMPEIENHMQADKTFFRIDIGILYLVIAFGIFGTLLMMTNERKNENGMLLAIGMRRSMLGAVLFLETLLIGLLGAVIGMLCSLPIVSYLEAHPIRISGEMAEIYQRYGFEPIFPAAVEPGIFMEQALIIGLLTIALGLYPLVNVLRIDPLKAIKNR